MTLKQIARSIAPRHVRGASVTLIALRPSMTKAERVKVNRLNQELIRIAQGR